MSRGALLDRLESMDNKSIDDKVIVIGGGLAGLAAAATAARDGAKVTLLEAQARLGGRARTDQIEGFALLRGPHALYGGGPGERVLEGLGVKPAGRTPSSRHHRLLRGGRLVPPPYAIGGWREMGALRVLFRILREQPERHLDRSAAEWVNTVSPRGPARDLLTALVRTAGYTSALEELPAPIAIDQAKRAIRPGVRYLDGGWRPMIDALAATARQAGAVLRCHAKVQALLEAGGVRLADGEELPARRVVIAGLGPGAAARLLETAGGAPPVREPRPIEAACLDVALTRLPRPDQRFVMGVDEPVFLTEATRAARDSAPPGGAVVHVARYLRDAEDRADRTKLEELLELAQPGWRDLLVHARYLPRMTVVEHLGQRPAIDATGLPHVLLAGDWIGNAGWLSDASLASGAAAGTRAAAEVRQLRPL